MAQGLGVVGVGIVGKDLKDALGEQFLGGEGDHVLVAWIGKALGQPGNDAEFFLKGTQRQQAGVADDLSAAEIDGDLLLADGEESKLSKTVCGHDKSLRVRFKF